MFMSCWKNQMNFTLELVNTSGVSKIEIVTTVLFTPPATSSDSAQYFSLTGQIISLNQKTVKNIFLHGFWCIDSLGWILNKTPNVIIYYYTAPEAILDQIICDNIRWFPPFENQK